MQNLYVIAVAAIGLISVPIAPAAAQTPSHPADTDLIHSPNIIVMMADDMGMGDTSAYQDITGNGDDVQLHTPAMERLARMGVRLTDAHTPSSRCTPTRYGLLTGRYPWRNRLKHWVLFGVQGDPMIEADRPTIASMLKDKGYRTGMVGKWHVGLRYRRSDGGPAAGWQDADLTKPMYTTPIDHGFDYARFTSRSHGTSGPDAGAKNPKNKKKGNGPKQSVGPGHVHGKIVVGATANGKQLAGEGPNAYILTELGGRHSDHAMEFLNRHVGEETSRRQPFFLYYASNSNHSPYTPDAMVGDQPVVGAGRTKSGKSVDARHDFIYENDVALGRLLNWLQTTNDPRQPDCKLLETTLVIFTSDNGAEKNSDIATGPFRSHKGSVYEGGHRVPFIASWSGGGIGDGDAASAGQTSDIPMGLQDLFATFAEITESELPDLRRGEKGAEDSFSILAGLLGESIPERTPMFFNDHKEAQQDHAAAAIRIDSPKVGDKIYSGKWKLFFDAGLLRRGMATPTELYNLDNDQWETRDLLGQADLQPLVDFMSEQAIFHRTIGGHRAANYAPPERGLIEFREGASAATNVAGKTSGQFEIDSDGQKLTMTVQAANGEGPALMNCDSVGLGVDSGPSQDVDGGAAILLSFDTDVMIESVAIVAGAEGVCGGFYQVADAAPLAVYCVDADIDAQDQSGVLSDIGVLLEGQTLRIDSRPHFGVESAGRWRLESIRFRVLQ